MQTAILMKSFGHSLRWYYQVKENLVMSVVRIALIEGKISEYLDALSELVNSTFPKTCNNIPSNLFQIIQQMEPETLIFSTDYEENIGEDDMMLLNVVAPEQSALSQKAFFGGMVLMVNENVQVRPETFLLVYSKQKQHPSVLESVHPFFRINSN